MNIFAQLSFDYIGNLFDREQAAITVIHDLCGCQLCLQSLSFKPGKMLIEVLLEVEHGPRHEGEAEADIRIELEKANLDASILIVHGTEYVSEEPPYRPQMTLQSQLRHGE